MKTYQILKMPLQLSLLLIVLSLSVSRAFALDRNWNNAAGGDFNTATSWTPSGVPGAADNAIITKAGIYTVTMSANASVGALTLGGASGTQTLDLSGRVLTTSAASAISAHGDLVTNDGTLTTNATFTVNGKLTHDGGTIQGSGAQTIASGGTLNWSGGTMLGTVLSDTTTIASGATLNLLGDVTLNKRTLVNNGTINLDNTDGILRGGNGSILNNENNALIDLSAAGDYTFARSQLVLNNKAGAKIRKRLDTGNVGFQDVVLDNSGTIEVQTGSLSLRSYNGGASGKSSGTFDTATDTIIEFAGTPHDFQGANLNGEGLYVITGDLITVGTTATVGSGATLQIAYGTLTVKNGGTLSIPTGAKLLINDSYTSLLTVAGGGTFNVGIGGVLDFQDGTLNGAGTVQIQGTLNWSGGTMLGTVLSDTTTIASGATLNLLGDVTLNKRTLVNNGTINLDNTDGILRGGNGSILNNENNALIDLSAAGDYTFARSQLVLNNKAGAKIRKRLDTGNVGFQDVVLDNSGTIEVQTGSLSLRSYNGGASGKSSGTFDTATDTIIEFAGTPHDFQGANLNGEGLYVITGDLITVGTTATVGSGATLQIAYGTLTVKNGGTLSIPTGAKLLINDSYTSLLTVAGGGTFNVGIGGVLDFQDGTLNGAGTVQIQGTLNWSGGTMSGAALSETTTIASGATLNLLGGVSLNQRTLVNNGTINLDNTDGIISGANGSILNNENNALIDLSAAGDYTFARSQLVLNNKAGAKIRKRLDTGNVGFQDVVLDNSGTIEVQTGSLSLRSYNGGASGKSSGTFDTATDTIIEFAGTPHDFQGANLKGTGTYLVSGDLITVGTTATVGSGATLQIAYGTLTVKNGGTLSIPTGAKLLINDSYTSLLTVAGGGTFNVGIGGVLDFQDGTLNGAGTVQIQGTLDWSGGTMSGAALSETTTIASGATLNLLGGVSLNKRTLVNNGTINLDNTDGIISGANGSILNNENNALIDLSAAGDYTFARSQLVLNNKAGAKIRKRLDTGNVGFQDVVLDNSGTIEVQTGSLSLRSYSGGGSFANFSGTTLTGGTYLLTGIFQFPGANVVTNAANVTLTGTGSAILDQSNNNGLANFAANASNGNLTIQGGRTLTLASTNVSNAGTVTIGSGGKLNLTGAGKNYTQSAGSTVLQGGTLATTSTGQTSINGGTLTGNGTVSSTLVNAGTVSPGFSAGVINVSRNYTQSGAFNVELGGTNAATPDYDQLKVTGTVTLGGSLNVSLINGFSPAAGATFTIISNSGTDDVSGTFAGLPQGATISIGGKQFQINYFGGEGNDVVLAYVVPTISIADASVIEGNAGSKNLDFKVTLSPAASQAVTVNYSTVNGTAVAPNDYTATSGTLTFAPGETNKIISVPVIGDTLDEVDEFFRVNLSAPTNATIADAQGIGTITDDDHAPSLTINNVTVTEGNSGTTNATFTITLSTVSGQTVSVSAAPYNGTATSPADYTSGGVRLTFAPGETSKTFSVPVKGDLLDEPSETFYVVLSSPTNASIGLARGTGTILDNDPPPSISIDDVRIGEGNNGQRTAVFRLKLSAPSGQVVRVNYSTGGGTATGNNDYVTITSGQIAFTTGNLYAYARVLINGDFLTEPDETFFVTLSGATGATITDAQALGTILNDDSPPALTISDASITEGNSGTKNLNFTVTLSKPSGQTVTVKYASADGTAKAGSDYAAKTGTLSFASGQTSKTISIVINGDTIVEGDETLFVFLSGAVNASVGRARGVGTITNDDSSG